MPRVNTKSTVDQVQDCMKEESGWEGELSRWKNLRVRCVDRKFLILDCR